MLIDMQSESAEYRVRYFVICLCMSMPHAAHFPHIEQCFLNVPIE